MVSVWTTGNETLDLCFENLKLFLKSHGIMENLFSSPDITLIGLFFCLSQPPTATSANSYYGASCWGYKGAAASICLILMSIQIAETERKLRLMLQDPKNEGLGRFGNMELSCPVGPNSTFATVADHAGLSEILIEYFKFHFACRENWCNIWPLSFLCLTNNKISFIFWQKSLLMLHDYKGHNIWVVISGRHIWVVFLPISFFYVYKYWSYSHHFFALSLLWYTVCTWNLVKVQSYNLAKGKK